MSEYQELTDAQVHELNQTMIDESASKCSLLVHPVEPLSTLLNEYQGNLIFLSNIKWLLDTSEYTGLRRLKGDGNCFYRAFSYAYINGIQHLQDAQKDLVIRHIDNTLELLKQTDVDEEIARDFFEPFQKAVTDATSVKRNDYEAQSESLQKTFNDSEASNSIVVYMRLLASAYLKIHQDEYFPFVVSENASVSTMQEFCVQEVEAFGKDADHIQITALCSALRASLKIVYLQGSSVDIPPETMSDMHNASSKRLDMISSTPCDIVPFMTNDTLVQLDSMLYRPGHFDLLSCA